MTREITHMKAFMAALDSLGLDPLSIGKLPPTQELVGLYFNDSTGVGDDGEADYRGPWNEEPVLKLEANPAIEQLTVSRS
jgi:Mn-containing catalase